MIQGVIFDMDGLMFDTERIWNICWEPALAKFGLPCKDGLSQAARGTTKATGIERAVEAIAEIVPTYHPAKNRPGNKPEQAAG